MCMSTTGYHAVFVKYELGMRNTAELVINSVGCLRILFKFAIVIFVSVAKVYGTTFGGNVRQIKCAISVIKAFIHSTDKSSAVSVPIILIIAADVIIYVNSRGNAAICNVCFTKFAKIAKNSSRGNIPRAPKSRDGIGFVNGYVLEREIACLGFGIAAVIPAYDAGNARIIGLRMRICYSDIFKGSITCRVSRYAARGSKFTL